MMWLSNLKAKVSLIIEPAISAMPLHASYARQTKIFNVYVM